MTQAFFFFMISKFVFDEPTEGLVVGRELFSDAQLLKQPLPDSCFPQSISETPFRPFGRHMPSCRELWAEAESSAAVVIVVKDLGWTESTTQCFAILKSVFNLGGHYQMDLGSGYISTHLIYFKCHELAYKWRSVPFLLRHMYVQGKILKGWSSSQQWVPKDDFSYGSVSERDDVPNHAFTCRGFIYTCVGQTYIYRDDLFLSTKI